MYAPKPTEGENRLITALDKTVDRLGAYIDKLPRPVAGQDNVRTLLTDIVIDATRIVHATDVALEAHVKSRMPDRELDRGEKAAVAQDALRRLRDLGDPDAYATRLADQVREAHRRLLAAHAELFDHTLARENHENGGSRSTRSTQYLDESLRAMHDGNVKRGRMSEARQVLDEADRAFFVSPEVTRPLLEELQALHTVLTGRPIAAAEPDAAGVKRGATVMRVKPAAVAAIPIDLGEYAQETPKPRAPGAQTIDRALGEMGASIHPIASGDPQPLLEERPAEPDGPVVRLKMNNAPQAGNPAGPRHVPVSYDLPEDSRAPVAVGGRRIESRSVVAGSEVTLPGVLKAESQRMSRIIADLGGPATAV